MEEWSGEVTKGSWTGRTAASTMRPSTSMGFPMNGRQKEQGVSLVELVMVGAIALIIIAMAVPTFLSTRRNYRAMGDARDVSAEILLAKMRGASDFTQARARFDTSANTFQIEIWDKTNSVWAVDAPTGTMSLSQDITLGYGAQGNPPPGTQATIGQGNSTAADATCYMGASGAAPGSQIANTACIVFNSRGIPIDHTGSPTGNGAIYLTDGKGVYAATISATGLIKQWRIDVGDTNAAHWNLR